MAAGGIHTNIHPSAPEIYLAEVIFRSLTV